jgi:hypothetical protein
MDASCPLPLIPIDDDEAIWRNEARKENVMRSIMRNAVLTAGAILLCAAGTARASTSTVLEANVPFPFVVNGQNFPAGKYSVQRDDMGSSVLLIRSEKGNHAAAFVSTTPDGGNDPAGSQPSLTFKRHENQYRLSSIWESAHEGWDIVSG